MTWTSLDTAWRSLVPEQPLSADRPPFRFPTPGAWAYGAISDPLPGHLGRVVKVRFKCLTGRVSMALAKPNGSAFLSQEPSAAPQDGEVELLFLLEDHYGPASLVLRNYGEPGSGGEVLAAHIGALGDLRAGEEARLVATAAPLREEDMPALPASNVAQASEPMWPISLGNTCEAKVQIARVLQFRRWPQTSHAAFRLQMLPPNRSADRFGWDLFDWQGAPFNAVMHYLDTDFEGAFERSDLITDGRHVQHRTLACEHCHDFEHLLTRADAGLTEEIVDRGYPAARERFERLAAAFRVRLTQPGPFLYVHVCEDIPSEYRVRQLIQKLAARSADHRFHLLFVGFEDEDSDLSRLSGQVSKAYRPRPPADADPMEWEGDYAAWDRALAPFTLLLPGETAEAAPAAASGR